MTVTRRVRIVETVAGEHFDLLENFACQHLADAICLAATFDKFPPLLGHLLRVLLAHRATQ